MLGFGAIGRLALGQPEQNFAIANGFLRAAGGTGSVGSIVAKISSTPMGVVASASPGIDTTIIMVAMHGAGGAGHAGNILTPDNDALSGVSGTGSAGTILATPYVMTINGVQAVGGAGTIRVMSSTVIIPGVATMSAAGIISTAISAFHILGVSGTGSSGKITTKTSGGGGGKKPKMGLEPVAKQPPAPPIPVKLPTYVLPNFKPKAPAPLPPAVRTPFERSPGIAPLDLMGMRQQIQSAQDEADIKAVLVFLDDLD